MTKKIVCLQIFFIKVVAKLGKQLMLLLIDYVQGNNNFAKLNTNIDMIFKVISFLIFAGNVCAYQTSYLYRLIYNPSLGLDYR